MADRKQIKVRLYSTENDDYNELWKVVGSKNRFFARHVFGRPTWYYVCDPLGYCELDSPADDIDFIVCSQKNKPLFTSNNHDRETEFKTFAETARDHFCKINSSLNYFKPSDNGTQITSLNDWLLSFMDPSKYKQEIEDMYGYAENWLYARTDYVGLEPIPNGEFEYLGNKYQICWRISKHVVCGKEFREIVCCDSPAVIDEFFQIPVVYKCYGAQFDLNDVGTMYSERQARAVLKKALVDHFGDVKYLYRRNLSPWSVFVSEEYRIGAIADYLIPLNERRRDLTKTAVDAVAEKIRNGEYDNDIALDRDKLKREA